MMDIAKWREPQRLIQLCQLVAFARPGFGLPVMRDLEGSVPGVSHRVVFVEVPQRDIRATDIRQRIAKVDLSSGWCPGLWSATSWNMVYTELHCDERLEAVC